MGRRKRTDIVDLVVPVAMLIALWSFVRPDSAPGFLRWAIVITCLVAIAWIVFAFTKRKRLMEIILDPRPQPKPRASPASAQAVSGDLEKRLRDCSTAPSNSAAPCPTEWSLQLIELLEWKRFEEVCAAYFEAKGHAVKLTDLGADGGVDFYLYGQNGTSTKPLGAVQCKAWSSSRIGVKSIRELLGIMTDVGCPLGIFITTTSYTPDAEKFASGKYIQLLDGKLLLNLIRSLPDEKQADLLKLATAGDYRTPSCPSCGTKLLSRTAGRGRNLGRKFWGCMNYPRCRYTMQARAT